MTQRMNRAPRVRASLAPSQPPATEQHMAGTASAKSTLPAAMRVTREAMLLNRFTGLAVAEAATMSMPSKAVNSSISIVPVPGPKKPS